MSYRKNSPCSLTSKTGTESFSYHDQPLGPALFDFWRWSVSDLVSNATRGMLAEFIVANALGIDLHAVREEWAPIDTGTIIAIPR